MSKFNSQGVMRARPEHAARLIVSATGILLEDCLQPLSLERVTVMVARCVNDDGALAGFLGEPDNIEASVGLAIERFCYTDSAHLRVSWMGTHPLFRGGPHMARLMDFAKWASETMKLPLYASLLTTEDLEPKFHAYLRRLPQVGAMFSWGAVPPGNYSQRFIGDDPHYNKRQKQNRVVVAA